MAKLLTPMVARKHKEADRRRTGQAVSFKDMSPLTCFFQPGSAHLSFSIFRPNFESIRGWMRALRRSFLLLPLPLRHTSFPVRTHGTSYVPNGDGQMPQ